MTRRAGWAAARSGRGPTWRRCHGMPCVAAEAPAPMLVGPLERQPASGQAMGSSLLRRMAVVQSLSSWWAANSRRPDQQGAGVRLCSRQCLPMMAAVRCAARHVGPVCWSNPPNADSELHHDGPSLQLHAASAQHTAMRRRRAPALLLMMPCRTSRVRHIILCNLAHMTASQCSVCLASWLDLPVAGKSKSGG